MLKAPRRQRESWAAMSRLSVNFEPKGAVGPLLNSEKIMTQKSVPKPNNDAAAKIVVFGFGNDEGPTRPGSPIPRPTRGSCRQTTAPQRDRRPQRPCRRSRHQAPGWPDPCGRTAWCRQSGKTCTRKSSPPSTHAAKLGGTGGDGCDRHAHQLGRDQAGSPRPVPRKFRRRLVGSHRRQPIRRQAHPPVP